MNKMLTYVGGLIGAFGLSHATFDVSVIQSVLSFISSLGIVVFSFALLWEGIKNFQNK